MGGELLCNLSLTEVAARRLVETGDDWVSQSITTPIAAILPHPDFGGRRLELVTTIRSDAEVPTLA